MRAQAGADGWLYRRWRWRAGAAVERAKAEGGPKLGDGRARPSSWCRAVPWARGPR